MKVLCVRQPWAELIRRGTKTIELRTWSTRYRGAVIVAASLARARQHPDVDGVRGALVCVTELVNVRAATSADDAAACTTLGDRALYAWELGAVADLPPVPLNGRLNLFEPDEYTREIVADVLARRAAVARAT